MQPRYVAVLLRTGQTLYECTLVFGWVYGRFQGAKLAKNRKMRICGHECNLLGVLTASQVRRGACVNGIDFV